MLKTNEIPTQTLSFPLFHEKNVSVSILRLDLVHPDLSGNKFFKLRHNLMDAQDKGFRRILTFGGAYSNHIYAMAAAGKLFNMDTVGVIRGEIIRPLNPTLDTAEKSGMVLYPMDRNTYKKKEEAQILDDLRRRFGPVYVIPEGGTNSLAILGCKEILHTEHADATHVAVCVGTGGTIAGITASALAHQSVLGFSALKGDFIKESIRKLLETHNITPKCSLDIVTDYHFGGYAKHSRYLITFMQDFYKHTGIPLDPIYTGKMVYGLFDKIRGGYFPTKSKILIIHSGGLQGIKGFEARFGFSLYP
ncbi:1-aminocyclopropane-1-carboxylate deaminase/D-cysteine desulfhydrase [Lunatibacter salilacus]|uniref:1-aminocyclopropane-1-carboxylate deaminase/D-cysteine desulfhydrase n=1 Tax=Lunatibacter salilacus TaxID=2483804 RepID=UPI00131E963A|nr:pyridoxal-phosphate dependent enzyme [Lunatibacter salilacus]